MSDAAKPPEITYELAAPGGAILTLAALSEADAQRLGTAFAAIDPWATYGYPADVLVKFLATSEPGASRLALTYESNVVGAAVVRTAWLRGPYLQFLAILPGAQRQGLGAAFLAWMEREARATRERNLWVAASEINADAIRFYLRHGFQPTAHLDDLVCDGRTEILFRKRLG
jgi:GNAT superfamily N-acetyltransferase